MPTTHDQAPRSSENRALPQTLPNSSFFASSKRISKRMKHLKCSIIFLNGYTDVKYTVREWNFLCLPPLPGNQAARQQALERWGCVWAPCAERRIPKNNFSVGSLVVFLSLPMARPWILGLLFASCFLGETPFVLASLGSGSTSSALLFSSIFIVSTYSRGDEKPLNHTVRGESSS